jgi:hypothetical protein
MSAILRFPDYETLIKDLCNHKSFKDDKYFKEKGITPVVTELAAERFADSEASESGVQLGTATIIFDLKRGKDGYTGLPLKKPDIDNGPIWNAVEYALGKAILACGKKVTDEKKDTDEKKESSEGEKKS